MAMNEQQIQLVIAAQNGDVKSFEELYEIYYGKIYTLSRMILRNETDAEDVLQETFITAWRKLNTLEAAPTFSVWLQIIAKNLCNNQLKRKNISILLDADKDIENFDTEESDELLPAIYAERTDLKERLDRIINNLSEVQRQAIVLYYFNELSVEEISEVMECSVNTVKTRLFLARKTIRAEIEEQERKSGEKFYGIIGIPMLPFGELVRSHLESLSISQSAATSSLSAITESISSGAAPAAPSSAANVTGAAAKTMSTAAKIIIGVVSVVVVGVVVVLLLMTNNGNRPPAPSGGNTQQTETTDPVTQNEETPAAETSGAVLGESLIDWLQSGTFYMSYTADIEAGGAVTPMKCTTAAQGGNISMIIELPTGTMHMVEVGGVTWMLEETTKMAVKSPVSISEMNAGMADFSKMERIGAGTGEIKGKTLPYEEYSSEAFNVKFYIDGGGVYAIVSEGMGSKVVALITEAAKTVPGGNVGIPQGYTQMNF